MSHDISWLERETTVIVLTRDHDHSVCRASRARAWGRGVWRDLVRLDTRNISKGACMHDTRHEMDRKFGFGYGGLFMRSRPTPCYWSDSLALLFLSSQSAKAWIGACDWFY